MTPQTGLVIVLGVAALAVALMLWGWSRRLRRDTALTAPLGAFEDAEATVAVDGLYVATTVHDDKLNRLAVRGLAYRAKVRVSVGPSGVMVEGAGRYSVLIPATALVSVDRANFTIDRVVERGGMVQLNWRITPDTIVDSYFRLHGDDTAHVITAIDALLPHPTPTGQTA